MQGIYIDGRRPKSKKAIKEAVAASPEQVEAEATALIGHEFSGSIVNMPEGEKVAFVGPDPYRDRKFYGTITKRGGKLVVS